MDLQSYLRGLGVGIAVTTIILTVSFAVSGKEPDTEEIIERAKALGMVESTAFMPSTREASEVVTEVESTIDNSQTEPVTQETTETVTEAVTEKITEAATEKITEPVTQGASEAQKESMAQEPETSGEITVEVRNFSQAFVAAQILQEAGVVDDADAFTKFMIDNGYATRLFEGTYTFTKGMSYDQVARIICWME